MSQKNTGAKECIERQLKKTQEEYQKLIDKLKVVSNRISELSKKIYK